MTPGFDSRSVLVRTSDGRNFVLAAPFTFTRRDGEAITVPAGAGSDGASTPPELWPTIPPFGLYWQAAFLHDFLYRCTDRPKAECDSIFLEAMEWLGVPNLEAQAIYEGVNLFGEAAFEADRKAQGGVKC